MAHKFKISGEWSRGYGTSPGRLRDCSRFPCRRKACTSFSMGSTRLTGMVSNSYLKETRKKSERYICEKESPDPLVTPLAWGSGNMGVIGCNFILFLILNLGHIFWPIWATWSCKARSRDLHGVYPASHCRRTVHITSASSSSPSQSQNLCFTCWRTSRLWPRQLPEASGCFETIPTTCRLAGIVSIADGQISDNGRVVDVLAE